MSKPQDGADAPPCATLLLFPDCGLLCGNVYGIQTTVHRDIKVK